MTRECMITGKKPMVGNNVSHANNRTKRRFLPNLHKHKIWVDSESRFITLRLSAKGLRTLSLKGVDTVISDLRAQGMKL